MSDPRSRIPSVEALLNADGFRALIKRYGRARVADGVRRAVDEVRASIAETVASETRHDWDERVTDPTVYASIAEGWLGAQDVPSLRSVINATGVVLHTNLGRAPLAAVAVEAMREAAGDYTNLEYDLDTGARGSRYTHCVSLLTELTGAEDAVVVNNAAGALVLALNTIALARGVVVSRGELVEIGGGFRIPEVIERSGAQLVEVGSTNRTRPADYANALAETGACALLKVHRSNFRMTGFTEEASVAELARIASDGDVPLVHDLGSGLMVEPGKIGLPREPRAAESLEAGAHVVVVSGDKLLGGPQAGIILGARAFIGAMRKNPLCRALRVDKVTLAGLEATLRLYRDEPRALREIPTLRMLSAGKDEMRARAVDLCERLTESGIPCEVVDAQGAVGGGTFPGIELPSSALELKSDGGADALAASLRDGTPPVVGRIVDDALLLDLRTVLPGQEEDLIRRVHESVSGARAGAE